MGEPVELKWKEIEELEMDARVELIRALLPLGLAEVGRMLDEEVERLAGPRHGRKNVTSYLPRKERKRWRGRMQRAYERPTYEEAKRDLKAIRAEVAEVNQSATASLDEGFEKSLTLHHLGVFPLVGRSLKTTNVIQSVHSMAEDQRARRLASHLKLDWGADHSGVTSGVASQMSMR